MGNNLISQETWQYINIKKFLVSAQVKFFKYTIFLQNLKKKNFNLVFKIIIKAIDNK